ncbi:hypothetical protein [Solirubrobacter soli]|uniref:hypothetical protein n=1 Tax=Solirubrobacter soli TaxID=363832 RepID=UPI00041039D4|nr:hypothetical protein [Solirubrobacter soli]
MLVLHEFRTNERPDDKSPLNAEELARFGHAVLGCELPPDGVSPWCVRVPDAPSVDAALYVAHVVTDLRDSTLVSPTATA